MKTILGWGLLAVASAALATPAKFQLNPAKTRQGQAVLLQAPAVDGLVVTAGPQTVSLWDCGKSKAPKRCGIVAVPLDTPIGEMAVVAKWRDADAEKTETLSLGVARGKFKVNKLTVEPSITRPSEEEQTRIAQDKVDIEAAYATPEAAPLWTGRFALPTSGQITSLFGNQRTYNGEVKSTHFGVDLRAGVTTPIHAVNRGKIVLAKDCFMAGNLVLIDHGNGIYSSYAHLSKIAVAVGDTVEKGQRIGIAGATGRVTGPHLHWSMKANGVPVDPHSLRLALNHSMKGDVRR